MTNATMFLKRALLSLILAIPVSLLPANNSQASSEISTQDQAMAAFRAAIADTRDRLDRISKQSRMSFIRTNNDHEGNIYSSRFTPEGSTGGKWTLIESISGEPSSAGLDWGDDVLLKFADYDISQAQLKTQTEHTWVFEIPNSVGVKINTGDEESDQKHSQAASDKLTQVLKNEIVISKENPRFLYFRAYSTRAFKPSAMVKVKQFDLRLDFAEAWAGGPLIHRIQSKQIKGKFGFFIRINNHTTSTNSDFKLLEMDLNEVELGK